MAYFQSRGLRGSALEEYINLTNTKYRDHGLGLVQKIPTPIKPVELDPVRGNIKKAFFEERSTVDYIGLVQGHSICFDAKETKLQRFPLKNIHHHQLAFMEDFEAQEGIAFFLIYFSAYDRIYFVPFSFIKKRIEEAKTGGPKSIPFGDFETLIQVKNKEGYMVHYIEALDIYLFGGEVC